MHVNGANVRRQGVAPDDSGDIRKVYAILDVDERLRYTNSVSLRFARYLTFIDGSFVPIAVTQLCLK